MTSNISSLRIEFDPEVSNVVMVLKVDVCPCQVMMDFHACHWPSHLGDGTGTELAQHFDQMNEPSLSDVEAAIAQASTGGRERPPVISFSHYLPFQVGMLSLPSCPKQWAAMLKL